MTFELILNFMKNTNIHHFIIVFVTTLLFTSCNVTNYVLKKTNKQYIKLGLSEWTDEQDSSSIHWRKVGSGSENLLLFHGFGPATELQWEDVVKFLYRDFTIYIPDLVYFGESTSKVENYDPRFITRQIANSINININKEVYIAGVSFGGLIGSLYANHYPENTKGLVLIDALSKFLSRNYTDSIAVAYGYPGINDILIPEDGKSLKTLFQLSYHKPANYPKWMLNKPAQQLYANQRKEKEKLLDFLKEHETELRSLDYPYNGKVQIIWGKEDILIPVSNAYLLKEYYPNSELTILPDVGHVSNMDAAQDVARIIKNTFSK